MRNFLRLTGLIGQLRFFSFSFFAQKIILDVQGELDKIIEIVMVE